MGDVNIGPSSQIAALVQVVSSSSTAVNSGTTIIPKDDTIPQNNEGDQFLTASIVPRSSLNTLVIDAVLLLSNSVANDLIAALFQDSTANALAATMSYQATATAGIIVTLRHTMTANTVVSTTFNVRAGGASAGTTTFNGLVAARYFGAITKSSLVIWEYRSQY